MRLDALHQQLKGLIAVGRLDPREVEVFFLFEGLCTRAIFIPVFLEPLQADDARTGIIATAAGGGKRQVLLH